MFAPYRPLLALSNHTLTIAAWYGVAVVKLRVINCSDSRTVRHAFLQTPIMMQMRVYFKMTWGGKTLKLSGKFIRLWWCKNLSLLYKSLNCLAPDYMSSKFILRNDLFNSYNLRDSENKLAVPLPRTNYYRYSFCYSGAVLWNNLPTDVRQAKSLTSFRKLLTSRSNKAIHGKQGLILWINFICLFISSFIAVTVNSIVCNFFKILYIGLTFLPCINKSDDDDDDNKVYYCKSQYPSITLYM